jgi:hypothetical protein
MFAGAVAAFGLDVKITAPKVSGTISAILTLTPEIEKAVKEAQEAIDKEVKDIDSKPEKFIQAWGNSSVFSSHGATQRAYGGYDLFAFTVGSMVGLQLPSSPFDIADELDKIADKLNEERDLKLGLNPQILTGQFSFNTSKFLVNNLYLGLRFGYMKLDTLPFVDADEFPFSFKSMSFGLMANYQILSQKSILAGLLLWRGLNLGAGFIYQGTEISSKVKLDPIEQEVNTSGIGDLIGVTPVLRIDPRIALDIKVTTYTIPLEASTSIRFLRFLNLALGAGVDLGFGTSDMKIGASGDVDITGIDKVSAIIKVDTPGNVTVTAGGDMSPNLFNPKLMTGLGFNIGPVIIDIPVTWYFMDDGFNVGVTLGIVW